MAQTCVGFTEGDFFSISARQFSSWNSWPWIHHRSEWPFRLWHLSFQWWQTDRCIRDRQTDRQDGREIDWCHVGVYLSTTTGRNTSTAEPGQGPWIWLGQAAIWMAKRERGWRGEGIRRNQPANQPKPTWRMEQLQRGGREERGRGERGRERVWVCI